MRTVEDIEAYLYKMEIPFETPSEGMWVLHDRKNHVANIVLYHDPPLLNLRLKVMPVPAKDREALYDNLLRLNATEMVHGAYGIEDTSIVLVHTLQSSNLDYNELQSAIDSVILAVNSHRAVLERYSDEAPVAVH